MEFPLKTFFFLIFLLSAATGQFQTESAEIPEEEKSRQFHIDEHKDTREILKSEMERYLSNLREKMTRSNSEMLSKLETLNGKLEILSDKILKIEGNQEELSTNFFRNLHENTEMKLSDSFNKRQTSRDLKMETSLLNFSATLTQKLSTNELKLEMLLGNLSALVTEELRRSELKAEASLRNLSESFGVHLRGKESQVTTEELGSLNETLRGNSQQPSQSLGNLTHFLNPTEETSGVTTLPTVASQTEIPTTAQPPTQTEVEEVRGKSGTIEFRGGANSHLRRKLWVFRSEPGNSYLYVRFELEENGLDEEARLSTWSSSSGGQDVWTGLQSGWSGERTFLGNLVVLTLTIPPSATKQPSFKLKFTATTPSDDYVYTSEVARGEGRQVVSFPPNNTNNYPPRSMFVALIAAPSGRPVEFTLKFLDLPGTPPDNCDNNWFYVYFLEESSTGDPYKQLPRRCGRVGAISEPLGNSTVAILRFFTWRGSVGRGFRVEGNPI